MSNNTIPISTLVQEYLTNNYVNVSNKLLPLHVEDIILKAVYRQVPEDCVMVPKEEYDRFLRMENVLKRHSAVSQEEAELENKGLKETIGVILAQKASVWDHYTELKKEHVELKEQFSELVKEEVNKGISRRLLMFVETLKADVEDDEELTEALNAYLKKDYFEYIDKAAEVILKGAEK